jgi:hypothetical protein
LIIAVITQTNLASHVKKEHYEKGKEMSSCEQCRKSYFGFTVYVVLSLTCLGLYYLALKKESRQ